MENFRSVECGFCGKVVPAKEMNSVEMINKRGSFKKYRVVKMCTACVLERNQEFDERVEKLKKGLSKKKQGFDDE